MDTLIYNKEVYYRATPVFENSKFINLDIDPDVEKLMVDIFGYPVGGRSLTECEVNTIFEKTKTGKHAERVKTFEDKETGLNPDETRILKSLIKSYSERQVSGKRSKAEVLEYQVTGLLKLLEAQSQSVNGLIDVTTNLKNQVESLTLEVARLKTEVKK